MRLSSHDHSRTAARQKKISTAKLPQEVQDAISECLAGYLPEKVPIVDMSVADLILEEGEWWWDDQEDFGHRDTGLNCNEYIENMMEDADHLPPPVYHRGQLADGRHRVEAFRRAGRSTVPTINLDLLG